MYQITQYPIYMEVHALQKRELQSVWERPPSDGLTTLAAQLFRTSLSPFCDQLAQNYGSGIFSCALTLTVLTTTSPPFTRASTLKSPNAFILSPSMPVS